MTKKKEKKEAFSRREREIMDIVYREGEATAGEVLDKLAAPPSYSAVRAILRILETKGHLTHELSGLRYVYHPTMTREKASRSALDHLVTTFFDGSAAKVVSTLLDGHAGRLSEEQLEDLSALIERSRKEGR